MSTSFKVGDRVVYKGYEVTRFGTVKSDISIVSCMLVLFDDNQTLWADSKKLERITPIEELAQCHVRV